MVIPPTHLETTPPIAPNLPSYRSFLMAIRHFRYPRASRLLALALVSAILVPAGGCGHRRSAMRPVYGAPVLSPATVVPSRPARAMTTEPDPAEPFLAPIPATSSTASGDSVIKAEVSPPVPRAAEDEPSLRIETTTPESAQPADSASPELTRPNTARPSSVRGTSGRMLIPRSLPATSMIERVKPFLASPNDLLRPAKADRPWKYVVVHHSANPSGGYDQIDRDHRKVLGHEGCGYHFVIGNGTDTPDGQVEASGRWIDQKPGVHCRNGKTPDVNEYGIGICLVGNFDHSAPTPKQVAAAAALVNYLEKRYRIATDHVGTHDQFASTPTACPGRNFPREAIFGRSPLAAR